MCSSDLTCTFCHAVSRFLPSDQNYYRSSALDDLPFRFAAAPHLGDHPFVGKKQKKHENGLSGRAPRDCAVTFASSSLQSSWSSSSSCFWSVLFRFPFVIDGWHQSPWSAENTVLPQTSSPLACSSGRWVGTPLPRANASVLFALRVVQLLHRGQTPFGLATLKEVVDLLQAGQRLTIDPALPLALHRCVATSGQVVLHLTAGGNPTPGAGSCRPVGRPTQLSAPQQLSWPHGSTPSGHRSRLRRPHRSFSP